MQITNIILFITGIIVLLFGVGAFLNPNISKWINAPGGPMIKSIIAMIVGIIIIILAFIIEIPMR